MWHWLARVLCLIPGFHCLRANENERGYGRCCSRGGSSLGAGQLNIKRKVSFIVPIVENMVGKDAQRPGDVVVASNGTSINYGYRAEGRLILADALRMLVKEGEESG